MVEVETPEVRIPLNHGDVNHFPSTSNAGTALSTGTVEPIRMSVVTGESGSWQQQPSSSSRVTQVDLLDAVRTEKTARDAAEVRMIQRVIEFCAAHQVPEDEAATVYERGRDPASPSPAPARRGCRSSRSSSSRPRSG